jgi:hypothetical protein
MTPTSLSTFTMPFNGVQDQFYLCEQWNNTFVWKKTFEKIAYLEQDALHV